MMVSNCVCDRIYLVYYNERFKVLHSMLNSFVMKDGSSVCIYCLLMHKNEMKLLLSTVNFLLWNSSSSSIFGLQQQFPISIHGSLNWKSYFRISKTCFLFSSPDPNGHVSIAITWRPSSSVNFYLFFTGQLGTKLGRNVYLVISSTRKKQEAQRY